MGMTLLLLLLLNIAYSFTRSYEGVAQHEGQIVYYEKHTATFENNKLIKTSTEYLDPEGNSIGSLNSDHSLHLGAPQYTLFDKRQKTIQGLKWKQGSPQVFVKEKEDKLAQQKLLKGLKNNLLISGPGLVHFISTYMEAIKERGKIGIKLIIPGRLSAYDFLIKTIESSASKVEFEVKIKSWWLRLFTPKIRLIFDPKSGKLLHFEGLSNLRNEDGEMMSVDIQYHYLN